MTGHKVGTRDEWLVAREALLGDRLGRVRTEERGNGSRLLLAWRPEHRHG